MPNLLIAGILGAVGGLLLELVELATFLRRQGHPPWSSRQRPGVVRRDGVLLRWESPRLYSLAIAIRMIVGAAVAAGLSLAGPLNPLAAVVAGVGAYSVIDRWANGADVNTGDLVGTKAPRSIVGDKSARSRRSNGHKPAAKPDTNQQQEDLAETGSDE
jgi:hypothetical protein